jgi:hypothetical protein
MATVESSPINSLQYFNNIAEKEVAQKSGKFWECISRDPCLSGGYFYTFKLRQKFDHITNRGQLTDGDFKEKIDASIKAMNKIFPAVEPEGHEILGITCRAEVNLFKFVTDEFIYDYACAQIIRENTQISLGEIKKGANELIKDEEFIKKAKNNLHFAKILHCLGISSLKSDKGVFLTLPDREVFLERWNDLCQENKGLLKIQVKSSEEIAEDLEFVEAYLDNDVLLTKGKRFIHSFTIHLISRLSLIICNQSKYLEVREKSREIFEKKYQRLKLIESNIQNGAALDSNFLTCLNIFKASLSAQVDYITRLSTFEEIEHINSSEDLERERVFFQKNVSWAKYMKNRFGEIDWEKIAVTYIVMSVVPPESLAHFKIS